MTNKSDSIYELLYIQTAPSKFGGYKLSLLTDPLPSIAANFLLCSKCENLLRQACNETILGQFICEECSDSVNIVPAMPSRIAISDLKVQCPLSTHGCPWRGMLVGIETHVTSCVYFKIDCVKGCGTVLMRLEEEAHLLTNCVQEVIECEYCGCKTRMRPMNEHLALCPEIPMNCDLCGLTICRRLMETHLKNECPESVVACEYSKYGCGVNVKGREMEQHLIDMKLQHFQMQVLDLESRVLIQDMIIGDMQAREIQKDEVTEELKYFRNHIMGRVSALERNASITPSSVEIKISDLINSFQNTLLGIAREICLVMTLGYYKIEYSYSFLCMDMLSIFIEVHKGERDDELEWPLKASCNISILPSMRTASKFEYPPVEVVQNNPLVTLNEISPIASIDKVTALDPNYCENGSIRICIQLQTTAPLVKRL